MLGAMRSTSLLLLLGLLACGGSAPASAPTQLDLPVPPGPRAAGPRCPPPAGPPRAESRPELMRPPVARIPVSPAIQAMVDAADRDPEDRKIDAGRHPGELLAFLALRPGDRVADLAAGGGYSTELFSRAVGPRGRVYTENPALFVKFADKPWGERLKRLKNTVRVDRELDAPLPPDARNLDAVVNVLVYHDAVWMGVDRDKMNKAVYDALRHGGEYVIVDHSAPEGSGTQDVKTTHRIDELFVIRDIEKAGFHHVATGDFLRNPADTRDWNDSPREAGERRGTSDRFVLKFVKP
jgi:predicted methyltransferase